MQNRDSDAAMAKTKAKRKKRRARRRDERVSYLIEIAGWDWGYSFGVNDTTAFPEPYLEFRHLKVHGKLLQPPNPKVEEVELTLMPDQRLNEENRQSNKPQAVGSMSLRKGLLEALLPCPADALTPIMQALSAGKLRYATLDAAKLRYGQGLVRHYSLEESYYAGDWIQNG